MNGNKYILAFADIPDDLIRSASDDAAVRKVFRQHRSRRNKMLGALCCCIVVAVAAVGFGSQNRFGKTPALIPGEPTNTDHQIPLLQIQRTLRSSSRRTIRSVGSREPKRLLRTPRKQSGRRRKRTKTPTIPAILLQSQTSVMPKQKKDYNNFTDLINPFMFNISIG